MTSKTKTFAKLIAGGMNKTAAYDTVYENRGGTRKTRREQASLLAAKPDVRAEISEWEARLVPIGDLKACKERMLANMQDLACHARDEKVRVAASKMLIEYCEARENRETSSFPPAGKASVEGVVEELMRLAAVPDVLELEVEREGEVEPEATAPDDT
jgi:hypothetical protein